MFPHARTRSLAAAALGGILLLVMTASGSAGDTTGADAFESRVPDPYSKMEEGSEPLLDLTKRVAADFDYWSDRGVGLDSVHPDPKRGVVVIGAKNPDAVRAQLEQHYKDAPAEITVEQGKSGTPLR